jgi:beta-1,4-mannosyl-glycoprotein beta-1,4-N-acetylglucosaminyltransferase
MVFDCFTFFNELDLLELRLKLLDEVVDKFVICESNYTHSGKLKPYNFQENRARYSKWESKILYLPVEQSIEGLNFDKVDSYTPTDGSWVLENQQRMALLYAAEMIADEDMVLVGDLDEIPDPRAVTALNQSDILNDNVKSVSMLMLFHYYYNIQLNHRNFYLYLIQLLNIHF